MTEQVQTPLIGPLKQRGWREIMRFRPISNTPHVALVVVRQGRLASIIPANDRRVLSDYVTWPYDFREVDMRERPLLISRRVESCDVGYEFDTALKLIYQVERPERVALELEDALAELEQALAQSIRVTSRSFGVEQAQVFEEHLREALLYGDVLHERLAALGLRLCRADVVVDLDERARARSEALRDHMHERPLLARVAIESLDPASSFDVLVGGSYRLTSRVLTIVSSKAHDAVLQEVIVRTIRRVGITFAPQDYLAAAQAMAEVLRHDSLLQAELAAAEIELIRPSVKIQPDRHMVRAAQSVPLRLPEPESPDHTPREHPLLAGQADSPAVLDEAPPWADLGATFGRVSPPLAAGQPVQPAVSSDRLDYTVESLEADTAIEEIASFERSDTAAPGALSLSAAAQPIHPTDMPDNLEYAAEALEAEMAGFERADEESLGWVAPLADIGTHGSVVQETPPWVSLRAVSGGEELAAFEQQEYVVAQEPTLQTEFSSAAPEPFVAQPDDPEIDGERIVRWIALLKADDPALFKLWTVEIVEHPQVLPTILSALASDPATLALADDSRYQRALVLALAKCDGHQDQAYTVAEAAQPAVRLPEPAAGAEQAASDEPPPDWLRLRRPWRDKGGAA